jgi:HPt (histidine-containing phosphotransfer) domain-containing protein
MKLSQEEIQARLAEVRQSYCESLAAKRDEIVTKWSSLNQQWDNEIYQSLYLIVHNLAGSAETFGLAQITRDARTVVDLFKQHGSVLPDAALQQHISRHIDKLVSALDTAITQKD